jgi:hypothetical protein
LPFSIPAAQAKLLPDPIEVQLIHSEPDDLKIVFKSAGSLEAG